MTKAKVLEAIATMPEGFQLDDFFERWIFISKVERGGVQFISLIELTGACVFLAL